MLLSGCATTEPQIKRDAQYPANWPEPMPLSHSGNELTGTYANAGTAIDATGQQGPVTMSAVFPAYYVITPDTKYVSF